MKHAVYSLGIDIGSTTVKIAVLDADRNLLFSDYRRHFADIQGTLAVLIEEASNLEDLARKNHALPENHLFHLLHVLDSPDSSWPLKSVPGGCS